VHFVGAVVDPRKARVRYAFERRVFGDAFPRPWIARSMTLCSIDAPYLDQADLDPRFVALVDLLRRAA
jgi:hypothetical protein